MKASLRSDTVRLRPGMPFAFPSESVFAFAGIHIRGKRAIGLAKKPHFVPGRTEHPQMVPVGGLSAPFADSARCDNDRFVPVTRFNTTVHKWLVLTAQNRRISTKVLAFTLAMVDCHSLGARLNESWPDFQPSEELTKGKTPGPHFGPRSTVTYTTGSSAA
jgi:hypothetical protein